MRRPREVVGARAGDDVHESARRTPKLGGGALVHHHHLLYRVLIEREGGSLSAPLFAEKGVVEVGPIDNEVVEDAALAADVELVAVGALRDGDAGGKQGEVEEIAAIRGQAVHDLLREALRAGYVLGVEEDVALPGHGDAFELDRREPQREQERLADPQHQPLPAVGPEPVGRGRGHVVGAEREQGAGKRALAGRLHRGAEPGLPVFNDDHGPRDGRAGRIADGATHNSRGGLGLGGGGGGYQRGANHQRGGEGQRSEMRE